MTRRMPPSDKFGISAAGRIMGGLSANQRAAMSMSTLQATIETNVEGVRDAIVKAGFRPGRRVRVQVEYVDTKEVREAEVARLSAILDQYPSDPQFEGMSEDEVMAYAIQVVDEVRQERKMSAAK